MDRADWAPSVRDVGAIIRSRTKTSVGGEVGTFDSTTRPTGDQVAELIDTVVSDVDGECGEVPDGAQSRARRVSAIGTACLVELSFFQEQINTGRSPYPQLKAWYGEQMTLLIKQIAEINAGDPPDTDMDLSAEGSFPEVDRCDPIAFVGWSNKW